MTSFATLHKVLPLIAATNLPILLRGPHGIGKSTIVYDLAQVMGLPVVEQRISQLSEGDLTGLPFQDDGTTAFNPPDWLMRAHREPVVLFLDEIDRGSQELAQGVFQLGDSRRVGKAVLHPQTIVFAAMNGGEGNSEYQVRDLDPAELDRWTVFDLDPTVEEWIAWGRAENLNTCLVDFIAAHPAHLEHRDAFIPGKKYPSRRSWARLAAVLGDHGLLESGWDERVFPLASGIVGNEAAHELAGWVRNYQFVVSADDIIVSAKWDLIRDFNVTDFMKLSERILSSDHLKQELKDTKKWANIGTFWSMCPSDIRFLFWQQIIATQILSHVESFSCVKFPKDHPNPEYRGECITVLLADDILASQEQEKEQNED